MQIQFYVYDLTQDFIGNPEEWAKTYLKHFITQAKRRAGEMIKKFMKPFEKYLQGKIKYKNLVFVFFL